MKSIFRDMSIKPETAQEVTECTDPRGMRKRILEYGYRGDSMTKAILDSARYQGFSGEDTMTWLAFEALQQAEHLEGLVLDEVMSRPMPPMIRAVGSSAIWKPSACGIPIMLRMPTAIIAPPTT